MAQRFRLLWQPLSSVAGVGIVSAVLVELLFNSGRRSARCSPAGTD
jgi:hypothetical protein